MKTMFVGTYLCLATVGGLLALAALLGMLTTTFHFAWGVVGVTFLMITAMCLWLVCDCRKQ